MRVAVACLATASVNAEESFGPRRLREGWEKSVPAMVTKPPARRESAVELNSGDGLAWDRLGGSELRLQESVGKSWKQPSPATAGVNRWVAGGAGPVSSGDEDRRSVIRGLGGGLYRNV